MSRCFSLLPYIYHVIFSSNNFAHAGADVMNGLADSLLLGSPTPERRTQAEAWVKKAIAVIDDTRNNNRQDPEGTAHCELVLAAALFNLGSMREVCKTNKISLNSSKHLYSDGWGHWQCKELLR